MAADPHTPLPWKFVPWHIEEGPSAVRAPAGHIVCTTASDADAQLIEKAVNNHDALVKALREARRFIENDPTALTSSPLLARINEVLRAPVGVARNG